MHMCAFQRVSMTWLVQKALLSLIRSPGTGRPAPLKPSTVNGTSGLRLVPRLVAYIRVAFRLRINFGDYT